MSGPDVVTVDVPPRAGRGHVSPVVIVVVVPAVVTDEETPVARPLNSCAVTIWPYDWTENAAIKAAQIQNEITLSLPLFMRVLL
jgi:hypothetical protein